jgi:hypothetical protein
MSSGPKTTSAPSDVARAAAASTSSVARYPTQWPAGPPDGQTSLPFFGPVNPPIGCPSAIRSRYELQVIVLGGTSFAVLDPVTVEERPIRRFG